MKVILPACVRETITNSDEQEYSILPVLTNGARTWILTEQTDRQTTEDNTKGNGTFYVPLRQNKRKEWITKRAKVTNVVKKMTHLKCWVALPEQQIVDGTSISLVEDHEKEQEIEGGQSEVG